MDKLITRIIQGLVILALPVFLALTAGHLLINVWYLEYEYGKSDFPPDPYGFTQQQRLDLATISIRYLQRGEPAEVAIKLLEAQRLPGANKPLFDQSEISHMLDVKRFTDVLWRVQYAAGLFVIGGLILLLARKGTRPAGYRALFLGGIWTAGLLAFLEAHNLQLPDEAQVLIPECGTRPDFLYRQQMIAVYVDGPYHQYPERHARDMAPADRMEDLGFTVIRFTLTTAWEETVDRFSTLFRVPRTQ